MGAMTNALLDEFDELWDDFVKSNDVDPDFVQHVYEDFESVEEFILRWHHPIVVAPELQIKTDFLRATFKACMIQYWRYAHPQPPHEGDLWYDGQRLRVAKTAADSGSEWTTIGYTTDEGLS